MGSGFRLPAIRVHGSVRIMKRWIYGPATVGIDDKFNMAYIPFYGLGATHYHGIKFDQLIKVY